MSSVSVEALDAALRERGLRATPQRRQVLTAIMSLGHATPEQIHEQVHELNPSVNLSTVYRALELLESLGLVSHTHLDHGAPTYHLAAHARHLHLVCRNCGSVTEAELSIARPLAAVIAEKHGFTADLTHLSVHGLCADCSAADGTASGSAASSGSASIGSASIGASAPRHTHDHSGHAQRADHGEHAGHGVSEHSTSDHGHPDHGDHTHRPDREAIAPAGR